MPAHDHNQLINALALLLEKDDRYGLIKWFVPWGDRKTDLVGPFYPDLTCLRRTGRTKIMIEVETPTSFEDSDEIRRLEGLSKFCATNHWEFYIAVPDGETLALTRKQIEGTTVNPKEIFLLDASPLLAK